MAAMYSIQYRRSIQNDHLKKLKNTFYLFSKECNIRLISWYTHHLHRHRQTDAT